MKKIISLCFASFLLCAISYGQESSAASNKNTIKKECVPTKECAEKMGMTLEECIAQWKKAGCDTKATKTSSSDSETVVKASMETQGITAVKASCCTIEECAAKLGISVEECLARCKATCTGKTKTASTTKVASAYMVIEPPATETKKVNCVKASAACCKKSKN